MRSQILEAVMVQDQQIARLMEKLGVTGSDERWYATSRGVGHGSRPGTVPSERPESRIRTLEDAL